MTLSLILATTLLTVAAAVRSTWSPCGLSMLASITPLSETGRAHRYRTTATWFVAGSIAGGATLGALSAALAGVIGALSWGGTSLIVAALGVCLIAAASDLGVGGFRLPVHHRQVNERWLDQFRPWVYGAGFGWQIGTGLATYIMTAGVYALIVLGALMGRPWLAFVFGVVFGLVRGLSVLLGRRITSAETLRSFHLRFHALGPKVRRATIIVELAAGVPFAWLLSPWLVLAAALVMAGWTLVWSEHRRATVGVGVDGVGERAEPTRTEQGRTVQRTLVDGKR